MGLSNKQLDIYIWYSLAIQSQYLKILLILQKFLLSTPIRCPSMNLAIISPFSQLPKQSQLIGQSNLSA